MIDVLPVVVYQPFGTNSLQQVWNWRRRSGLTRLKLEGFDILLITSSQGDPI